MDPFVELHWFPLWLAHIIRGFTIVAAPACIIFCMRLARRNLNNRGQQYRFAGLGFLLMATTYTEIIRWDDVVTPRLFMNLAGTIFTILGLRYHLSGKEERRVGNVAQEGSSR